MKTIKTWLSTIAVLLFSITANAHDFEVGGIYYTKTSDTTVSVTYRGSYYNEYSNEYSGNVVIPSAVTYSGKEYSVTSIESYAFYDCSGLTSVTIPNSVTSIGFYAFGGCSGLTSVIIGNSVTSIGVAAFYGCSGLTSVIIPNSVTSIGDYAFRYCFGLTSVTIGNSVTRIGDSAFEDCSGLTSVTIPNSVTSIGSFAFLNCSGLTSVTIGNSVTSIGDYAFYSCSGLTSVIIPNSVTSIGNYTFNNCSSLADVVIEDRTSELTLGSNGSSPLFASCPLDSVYIGGKIKYNTSSSRGYSPFYRNTSLRTIVITDEEEEIYDNEFYGCTSLKNVTMGDGVKKIGKRAFSGCSNLDYFNFGRGMQSIGDEAFSDCTSLAMLISYAEVPPTCGSMSLDDINKRECVLRVPQNSLSAYQAADQWKEFFFIEDVLTGINEIEAETKGDGKGDVYSLNGTLLKRNVNVNRLNSILPAGLYVVNGKKVVVK